MKRVKLMLLSFCVLGAVGGALAFKAKGTSEYCYTTPDAQSPFCAKKCPAHTIKGKNVPIAFFCTTPTTNDPNSPCAINNVVLDCGSTSVKTTTTE